MTKQNSMLNQLLEILDDMQAIEVKVMDVRKQTAITDYMIVASGRSSRHVKSIASKAVEKMKKNGFTVLSNTGLTEGDWALVDFGDCILHVMQPETRAFYNLEGLWQDDAE